MGFVSEFRDFAVKGNVVDMAVGIILGMAFNKVVNSLVNDIIMPPIGLATAGVEIKDLKVVLKAAQSDDAGEIIAPEVAMQVGLFINSVVDFGLIALSAFIIVKVMNRVIRTREAVGA